jgi:parallel beta-helix repeat protein
MLKIPALWLCMLLVISSAFMLVDITQDAEGYIIHTPIRINSNVDFATYANGGGNGSSGNPWIIENYEINGTGYGYSIYVGNTTNYFVIRNCYLHHANGSQYTNWPYSEIAGLSLYNSQNGVIFNNTAISNIKTGIQLINSANNIISNNTASANSYGIYLDSSSNNVITNNTASTNYYAVWLSSSSSNTVTNNNASNNDYGIYVEESNTNTFFNNTMFDDGIVITGYWRGYWNTHTIDTTNTVNGKPVYYWKNQTGGVLPAGAGEVILANCSNVKVENQNLSDESIGILLGFSNNNTILNNTVSSNNVYGLSCQSSDNNTLSNNSACSNTYYGIYLLESQSNMISNTNVSSNNKTGIYLANCDGNTIINVSIGNNDHGIVIRSSSDYNNISYSNVFNNTVGIDLENSKFNQIINNNVFNNNQGIFFSSSTNNRIASCNITDNNGGIIISKSDSNKIFDNNISNNDFGFFSESSSTNYLGDNKITNSSKSSNASTYYTYETNLNVYQNDPNWGNYNTFEEQLATGDGGNPLFTRAIDISSSFIFKIHVWGHANCPDLDLGIFLDGKDGNPIDGQTQTGEFYAMGADMDADEEVSLFTPNNGTYLIRVFGFEVNANPGQFDMEITILQTGSTGLLLFNSSYHSIVNCNFTDNNNAINITNNSNFNNIHYNNFIGNTNQSYDDCSNRWNNTYPSGGNYWDDYTGVDLNSTPNQNVPPPDGFGDTAYNISGGGNKDYYPLINPTNGSYVDKTPPITSPYFIELDSIMQYCIIGANATDDYCGISHIELWYRYSSNGTVWTNWTLFDNASSPWSWFFAPVFENGNGYYEFYTIGVDELNNTEVKSAVAEIAWLCDNTAPQSSVNSITKYWQSSSPIQIIATAIDDVKIANVTLWYRYSTNQSIWVNWSTFASDAIAPYEWAFNFSYGEGYYEFYSIANDTANNTEAAPSSADTSCAYDITVPTIIDNSINSGTTGDPYTINTVIFDNLYLSTVYLTYWFGTGAETNATMTHTTSDNYSLVINIPLNSIETLHYRIAAVDQAGNWNTTAIKDVTIIDNDNPIADAGLDQTVNASSIVAFNGSGSTDNIGIVNCTWVFNDSVQNVTLYGLGQSYNFTVAGNYTITLPVRDAAGNADDDAMIVRVNALPPDFDGDGIPDETDPDNDNDGVNDTQDAFPLDPTESVDTDGDAIGNNADLDDDNDGYLDEWEIFLGTDALDSNSKPTDTDGDGKPDGDATNSQTWMDTDDDGDGVPDAEDPAPLDPSITEEGRITGYWLAIPIIIIVVLVIVIIAFKIRGKKPSSPRAWEITEEKGTP